MRAEMDGICSSKMALAVGAHSYALHGFNINASPMFYKSELCVSLSSSKSQYDEIYGVIWKIFHRGLVGMADYF